ncbi:MAG TPA: TerB family tellurite resistance protein [Labilithrix sp.]|nr:TerB family tellurite resistance protein [Labilithrix sp.]
MTFDAYAPMSDPKTAALGRLIGALAEDGIFGLSTGGGPGVLEGLGRRRGEAYQAILVGHRRSTMSTELDHWLIELTRAVAPIAAPAWLPMADLLREKVTLEVGARGLRSLFSSKPSEKEVVRVKRLGTLATRVLRAVYAADGPLDGEEQRNVAAFIASLGLPDEDAKPLFAEAPISVEQLDVYGDLEPAVAKALLRGAWLAAAWDAIDPREEHVVRVLANKLNFAPMDLEVLRNDIVKRVDEQRTLGQAAVDAIRFVLSDRMPGHGVTLAANTGLMLIPKRYREESLAQVGHGTKVALVRRHTHLSAEDKNTVLGIAWAASLYEDPSVGRRALLRARHDRVGQDLGEDGSKVRLAIDAWVSDVLAPAAFPMSEG